MCVYQILVRFAVAARSDIVEIAAPEHQPSTQKRKNQLKAMNAKIL
jgi:hypothetical protein